MDRLILFRHGKAEGESATGGDFDRRLTPRGVEESAATAERLAALGVAPAIALVSPAARTRGTWAAAEPALSGGEVRWEPGLYDAEPAAIRELIELAAEDTPGAVVVVGHNPGLQELTLELMRRAGAAPEHVGEATRRFPTAAAAVFRVDAQGRLAFEALVSPDRWA
jgi:phosphohistidine phosphatase